MIKNLSQLKKALKAGTTFEITAHCRPECIGEHRYVTKANMQGFYSIIPDAPQSRTSKANNGLGSWLHWSSAPFWMFGGGFCALYSSNREQDSKNLIVAFRVTEEVD